MILIKFSPFPFLAEVNVVKISSGYTHQRPKIKKKTKLEMHLLPSKNKKKILNLRGNLKEKRWWEALKMPACAFLLIFLYESKKKKIFLCRKSRFIYLISTEMKKDFFSRRNLFDLFVHFSQWSFQKALLFCINKTINKRNFIFLFESNFSNSIFTNRFLSVVRTLGTRKNFVLFLSGRRRKFCSQSIF